MIENLKFHIKFLVHYLQKDLFATKRLRLMLISSRWVRCTLLKRNVWRSRAGSRRPRSSTSQFRSPISPFQCTRSRGSMIRFWLVIICKDKTHKDMIAPQFDWCSVASSELISSQSDLTREGQTKISRYHPNLQMTCS